MISPVSPQKNKPRKTRRKGSTIKRRKAVHLESALKSAEGRPETEREAKMISQGRRHRMTCAVAEGKRCAEKTLQRGGTTSAEKARGRRKRKTRGKNEQGEKKKRENKSWAAFAVMKQQSPRGGWEGERPRTWPRLKVNIAVTAGSEGRGGGVEKCKDKHGDDRAREKMALAIPLSNGQGGRERQLS